MPTIVRSGEDQTGHNAVERGVIRIRVVLAFALASLAACSPPAQEPLPPIPYEGELFLLPSRVVGCYRVTSLEWFPTPPRQGEGWKIPPPSFELSSEVFGPTRYGVIAHGPPLRLGTWWVLTNRQELRVEFSGLAGMRLELRRRPVDGMYYGHARLYTDAAPPPINNVGTVLLRKSSCERS